ncbi:MAG: hypothetical protein D6761_06800 [Candidatus Dadabacteria bacterium]|nr:MAG: hypothetical protein D6761_06800 [Candidatus Dadabacteria bacterium]
MLLIAVGGIAAAIPVSSAGEACESLGGAHAGDWVWFRRYLCGADASGDVETFGEWFARPLLRGRFGAEPTYRFARLQLNGLVDGGFDRWRDDLAASPREAIDRFLSEVYPPDLDSDATLDDPVAGCIGPVAELCQAWMDDLHTFHLGRGKGAKDSRRLCVQSSDAATLPAVHTAALGLAALDEAAVWSQHVAAVQRAAEQAAAAVGWLATATEPGELVPVFRPPDSGRSIETVSGTVWELPWKPRRWKLGLRSFQPAAGDELPRLRVRFRKQDVELRSPLLWLFARVDKSFDLPTRTCTWSPDGNAAIVEQWNPRRKRVSGRGQNPWLRILPWLSGDVELHNAWYRRDRAIYLSANAWSRLRRFDRLFQEAYHEALADIRRASDVAPLQHRAHLPEVYSFELGEWTVAFVLRQRRLLKGLVRNDLLAIQGEVWRRILRRPFDPDAIRLLGLGPSAPFVCSSAKLLMLPVQDAFAAESLPDGVAQLARLVLGPCRLLDRVTADVMRDRYGDDPEMAARLVERYRMRFEGFLIGARQISRKGTSPMVELWRVTLPDTPLLMAVFGGLLRHALDANDLLPDGSEPEAWRATLGARPEMMLATWMKPERVRLPVAEALRPQIGIAMLTQGALGMQVQRPGRAVQSWGLSWHLLATPDVSLPDRLDVAGEAWPDALQTHTLTAGTAASDDDPFGWVAATRAEVEAIDSTKREEEPVRLYIGPGGRRAAFVGVMQRDRAALVLVLERCERECVTGAEQ